MSDSLYWLVEGEGPDVILIHGWGMNGAVWENTVRALKSHYRLHVVDLPGYGRSQSQEATSLADISSLLLEHAPPRATWVGWSLGGLVATDMALRYPHHVGKLVTVSSSPKFAASQDWKGIRPDVLDNFMVQLTENFELTIARFMALQSMGCPTARQDAIQLKQMILSQPTPTKQALLAGLTLLAEVDLRAQLDQIQVPFLRLYGRLDGLVPVQIAKELDDKVPTSIHFVFRQSSHAPFITESDAFCQRLSEFIVTEHLSHPG